MNTVEFIINASAIFSGLFIYMGIMRTKWGKDHANYQYAIMLVSVLLAALIGGILRWLLVVR
jgi:hypothetical protein